MKLSSVVSLVALLASSPLLASEADLTEARRLYVSANKHFALGEFDQAVADFKEAFRRKDDPQLLYDIAQCYRQMPGHERDALNLYRSYLQRVPRAANRDEVGRKIADLERLLSQADAARTAPAPYAPQDQPPAPGPGAAQPYAPPPVDPQPYPPVAPSPVVQWLPGARGSVPAAALMGGIENERPLAVCRARHQGGLHVGKVVGANCNFGYGGLEVMAPRYEVLVAQGEGIGWMPSAEGGMPPGAFVGGEEGGHGLVVCRARLSGGVHPGKLVGQACAVGYGGKEVNVSEYEVLVVPSPAPAVPPPVVRNIEAGPLWNDDHARRTCPNLCATKGGSWKGEWRTTIAGRMSVCGCVFGP